MRSFALPAALAPKAKTQLTATVVASVASAVVAAVVIAAMTMAPLRKEPMLKTAHKKAMKTLRTNLRASKPANRVRTQRPKPNAVSASAVVAAVVVAVDVMVQKAKALKVMLIRQKTTKALTPTSSNLRLNLLLRSKQKLLLHLLQKMLRPSQSASVGRKLML